MDCKCVETLRDCLCHEHLDDCEKHNCECDCHKYGPHTECEKNKCTCDCHWFPQLNRTEILDYPPICINPIKKCKKKS